MANNKSKKINRKTKKINRKTKKNIKGGKRQTWTRPSSIKNKLGVLGYEYSYKYQNKFKKEALYPSYRNLLKNTFSIKNNVYDKILYIFQFITDVLNEKIESDKNGNMISKTEDISIQFKDYNQNFIEINNKTKFIVNKDDAANNTIMFILGNLLSYYPKKQDFKSRSLTKLAIEKRLEYLKDMIGIMCDHHKNMKDIFSIHLNYTTYTPGDSHSKENQIYDVQISEKYPISILYLLELEKRYREYQLLIENYSDGNWLDVDNKWFDKTVPSIDNVVVNGIPMKEYYINFEIKKDINSKKPGKFINVYNFTDYLKKNPIIYSKDDSCIIDESKDDESKDDESKDDESKKNTSDTEIISNNILDMSKEEKENIENRLTNLEEEEEEKDLDGSIYKTGEEAPSDFGDELEEDDDINLLKVKPIKPTERKQKKRDDNFGFTTKKSNIEGFKKPINKDGPIEELKFRYEIMNKTFLSKEKVKEIIQKLIK